VVILTWHRPDKLKAMNRAAQEEHWQRGKMLNLELLISFEATVWL
jgi:hypothetical protein